MICPKCGRVIPDGVPCPCGATLLSSNPAVNLIKTIGSSTKFLTATILYSVAVLFALLATFTMQNLMVELYYYGANTGVDPEVFYPMMSVMESSSVAASVVASIPSVLAVVGMWLFYASCRSTQTGNVSTTGLTICKVISYISLVLYCLVEFLLVILGIIFVVAAGASSNVSYYGASSLAAAMAVIVIVLLLVAAFIALFIALQVSVIRTINRIKASAITGVPDNRISRFLTGFLMVMGILGAFSGVVSLITSPLAGIGALAGAATMILISLVLTEYRNKMTMLVYPPVQPVYGQNMPPYGNMPPQNNVPPQQPGGPNDGFPQQ